MTNIYQYTIIDDIKLVYKQHIINKADMTIMKVYT